MSFSSILIPCPVNESRADLQEKHSLPPRRSSTRSPLHLEAMLVGKGCTTLLAARGAWLGATDHPLRAQPGVPKPSQVCSSPARCAQAQPDVLKPSQVCSSPAFGQEREGAPTSDREFEMLFLCSEMEGFFGFFFQKNVKLYSLDTFWILRAFYTALRGIRSLCPSPAVS